MAAAPAAVRIAVPTILVGGEDQPELAEGLASLQVIETIDGLFRCEAVVGNWGSKDNALGYLFFDRQLLDFGKTFTVRIDRETVFDGRIMGLEAHFPDHRTPRLAVLAEDRFQDLRMTRRTRSFAEVSDADLIRQIAGDHSLQTDIQLSGPTHRVLTQVNQSDLAFLRDRVRDLDARLWMSDGKLRVRRGADAGGEAIDLTHGAGLKEFSVLADLAEQRTGVIVSGWDVAAKRELKHEATDDAIRPELDGGRSGADLLSAALGPRKESFVRSVPLTSQETQDTAEALFRRQARRFVRGRGVAEADGQLRVGRRVNLIGLGPLFSGKYDLVEVRHLFDRRRGVRTEVAVERPGLGQGR
jgi:Bacteriophage probable baseplate hub protein